MYIKSYTKYIFNFMPLNFKNIEISLFKIGTKIDRQSAGQRLKYSNKAG